MSAGPQNMPVGAQQGYGEVVTEIHATALLLLQQNRHAQALFMLRKALLLDSDHTDCKLAAAHALHSLGRYAEALLLYDEMIAKAPNLAAPWNNRGTTLLALRRFSEATDCYQRALEIMPGLHDSRVAMASCLQSLRRENEALQACEEVLAAAPNHAEAHWNRGLLLLLRGDLTNGWREYEWRWRKRDFTSPTRNFHQPAWRGEDINGKTILIHAEQGFGDTLQFCRYIPMVASLGARVIFECQPPLVSLMRGIPKIAQVVATGDVLPEFDLHLPLLSLAFIFGTTLDTIPAIATPKINPATAERWKQLIPDNGKRKIGLCWSGKSYPDPARSCPAEALQPLCELPGIDWYSLQVTPAGKPAIALQDLTGLIHDFSDSAALVSRMDLIITIDTAVAHLAGVMQKPVWTMLPYAPDWRWMLERSDSPWYPSMKLFRATAADDWAGIIHNLVGVLRANLTKHTNQLQGED